MGPRRGCLERKGTKTLPTQLQSMTQSIKTKSLCRRALQQRNQRVNQRVGRSCYRILINTKAGSEEAKLVVGWPSKHAGTVVYRSGLDGLHQHQASPIRTL